MSVIDDNEVMMLFSEALECRFRRSGYAALEVGFLTGPTEAIALAVFFGKH